LALGPCELDAAAAPGPATTTPVVITSSVLAVPGRWEHLCQSGQELGPVPPHHEGCAAALDSAHVPGTCPWAPGRSRLKLRLNYLHIL